MKKLTYKALKEIMITVGYPDFLHNVNNGINKSKFIYFNISYFDHWLTEDEFISAPLVCYTDVQKNWRLLHDFNQICRNFRKLYTEIFNFNDNKLLVAQTHSWLRDRISIELVGNNYHRYLTYVQNGLKEYPLCRLIFIEMGMVIDLNHDLTQAVYISKRLRNHAIELERFIKRSVKRNHLFII
ncbi:hypothetical protein PT286_09855 [Neisseriaceae bacterium ESL0693]|nr:hypothetical protein [Neisseriaceae bacterium ESL0693]